MQLDAVELDPEVVDVAYEYFELPRDPRLKVEVEDGRRYLARNDGPWDVIVDRRVLLRLDPVPPRDPGVPRAREVAADAGRARRDEHHRRRPRAGLAPLPLDAAHVPGRLPDGGDPPGRRRAATTSESIRNIILVAAEGAAPSKQFLLERWHERAAALAGRARPRRRRSAAAVDAPVPTEDVPVLTDDYAPTDALLLLFD